MTATHKYPIPTVSFDLTTSVERQPVPAFPDQPSEFLVLQADASLSRSSRLQPGDDETGMRVALPTKRGEWSSPEAEPAVGDDDETTG